MMLPAEIIRCKRDAQVLSDAQITDFACGLADGRWSDAQAGAMAMAVLLQTQQVDFTLAWRHLADAAAGDAGPLRDLFFDRAAVDAWLLRWQARHAAGVGEGQAEAMRRVNPLIIPRNHLVEEALAAAVEGSLVPFEQLLTAVQQPYIEGLQLARYAEPAPREVTARYQTFCGT